MQRDPPDKSDNGPLAENSQVAASVGLPNREATETDQRAVASSSLSNGLVESQSGLDQGRRLMRLDLRDGTSYLGTSFGAETSVSGELVF